MDFLVPRRALLSVTDKTGLADFARALAARGVELVSTGGTMKMLREQGLSALDEQGAAENRRLCHRSIVPSGAVDCHPHLTRTQETQLKAARSEPRP